MKNFTRFKRTKDQVHEPIQCLQTYIVRINFVFRALAWLTNGLVSLLNTNFQMPFV